MRGDFSDSMEKGTPGARTHLADYRCAAIIPCRSVTQVISPPNHGSLTSEILFVFAGTDFQQAFSSPCPQPQNSPEIFLAIPISS